MHNGSFQNDIEYIIQSFHSFFIDSAHGHVQHNHNASLFVHSMTDKEQGEEMSH